MRTVDNKTTRRDIGLTIDYLTCLWINPTYNSQIDWENIQNAICYQYELYKDGQLYLQGTESTNNFAVTNLEFGNYTFKVKAIGNNSTYLSSLEFGQVEFNDISQIIGRLGPELSYQQII